MYIRFVWQNRLALTFIRRAQTLRLCGLSFAAANFSAIFFQIYCALLRATHAPLISAGISNAYQLSCFLPAISSSAPSGAPPTLSLFRLLGEPKPIMAAKIIMKVFRFLLLLVQSPLNCQATLPSKFLSLASSGKPQNVWRCRQSHPTIITAISPLAIIRKCCHQTQREQVSG